MEKKCNAVFRKSDGAFMFAEENPIEQTKNNAEAMGESLENIEIRIMSYDDVSLIVEEYSARNIDKV